MKVLHLLKTSEGGTWAFRQMRELVKMGVEVHVAMPLDGKLVGAYIDAGIVAHAWECSLGRFAHSCLQLRKIVKEVAPDLIHSHFVLTTLVMRVALRGVEIPRVFQVPGPLHLENVFFRNLDVWSAQKRRDYWIASCKWTYDRYVRSGISPKRLFLSYYGTDLEFIKPQRGILKDTLHLSSSAFVVGMVAYMYAPKRYLGQKRGLKGHEDFIDALALLKDKYPNLYGVCIGGAWGNAHKYEKQVMEYGKRKCGERMFFLGSRTDVPALYGDMDLVVHPSHSENLGGAAESLLLGVPTIASNVGGFPDIVVNGETGLLVPAKSPKALAQAIDDVINHKYDVETFERKGLAKTKELLDVKNTAREVLRIYQKVKSID